MDRRNRWEEAPLSELQRALTELIEPVVRSEGLFLLELDISGDGRSMVLRIFVDREGGVSLAECEAISRQAGDILDVEDIIAERYRLEVSSPGLNRKLKYAREFDIFAGRKAKLLIKGEDKNYYLIGHLKGRQGSDVIIQVQGKLTTVALNDIIRAHLEPEFSGS
jgi:ribosome maturation factor RimP